MRFPDLNELLALARRLAARAAAIHRQGQGHAHRIDTKSSRTDVVTEVDREAERAIVEALLRERPDDAILGEEGSTKEGSTGLRWVIDPLDGSVNYLYGYPAYAVSIGVEIDGFYRVGVVHDTALDRVYGGVVGGAATCDGTPLRVNQREQLAQALLASGFGYDARVREWQARQLVGVLPQMRDLRRSGSAAVDLCLLAENRVDAYYECGLKSWDFAAGGVIARAAGARVMVLEPEKGPAPLVIAANPRLFDQLLPLVLKAGGLDPDTARREPWG